MSPFYTWDGIDIMVFSCTRVILVEITAAGRQPVLGITAW